jgi:hypothetical protein
VGTKPINGLQITFCFQLQEFNENQARDDLGCRGGKIMIGALQVGRNFAKAVFALPFSKAKTPQNGNFIGPAAGLWL